MNVTFSVRMTSLLLEGFLMPRGGSRGGGGPGGPNFIKWEKRCTCEHKNAAS